ncbi:helix-turn-helix domain-containing protein [Weissella confusa]|uniref:Helix-turn-helix domain-containing protein n=1 Tax=Weissella confusa TaxID=1583 RepID=A0A923NGS8_WEICO|nr:helix-turn-helix domain-containing protein [Weissella confusa]
MYFASRAIAALNLLATLYAFYHFNGDLSDTSQHLHIHRNTLNYRLDKLTEVLGKNPRHVKDSAILYPILLQLTVSQHYGELLTDVSASYLQAKRAFKIHQLLPTLSTGEFQKLQDVDALLNANISVPSVEHSLSRLPDTHSGQTHLQIDLSRLYAVVVVEISDTQGNLSEDIKQLANYWLISTSNAFVILTTNPASLIDVIQSRHLIYGTIGVVGISGAPEEVSPFARLVVTTTELLVEQLSASLDSQLIRQRRQAFISDWLHNNNLSAEQREDAHDISYNINIMNEVGIIIASSDKSRIGEHHAGAIDAIQHDYTNTITPNDPAGSARLGVNMPIHHQHDTI